MIDSTHSIGLLRSSSDGFVVGDCREADMSSVTAIYGKSVLTSTASFEVEPPTLAEMSARRAAILAHPGPYLAATSSSGEILGFAYAGPYRARYAYRFTVENTVYVADHANRRGVGLALLNTLIDRCSGLGYRQMIAVIGSGNPASVGLHERAGFHHVGQLREAGHKFDTWLDVILMQRTLGGEQ